MNFYKLYQLLNEYGQSLIQNLIKKFQTEDPGLNVDVIKSYIQDFERFKNNPNITNKDITTYSWKQLEDIVDSNRPAPKIKAGKIDTSVPDANLLYNKDGIRVYLGKDKNSCIKYGHGYTFCISARGKRNMYGYYRIKSGGTPYFVFNDNLPPEDNRHIMVIFVYENIARKTRNKYTLTLSDNSGDKPYSSLEEMIKEYPWLNVLRTSSGHFMNDENKGIIQVSDFEYIEHHINEIFSRDLEDLCDFDSAIVRLGYDVFMAHKIIKNLENNFKITKEVIFDEKKALLSNVDLVYKGMPFISELELDDFIFENFENLSDRASKFVVDFISERLNDFLPNHKVYVNKIKDAINYHRNVIMNKLTFEKDKYEFTIDLKLTEISSLSKEDINDIKNYYHSVEEPNIIYLTFAGIGGDISNYKPLFNKYYILKNELNKNLNWLRTQDKETLKNLRLEIENSKTSIGVIIKKYMTTHE